MRLNARWMDGFNLLNAWLSVSRVLRSQCPGNQVVIRKRALHNNPMIVMANAGRGPRRPSKRVWSECLI